MLQRRAPLDVLRLYPAHDYTLYGALKSRESRRQAELFLEFEGVVHSHAGFLRTVDRLARGLFERGVRDGDRVAIVARNHAAHVLLLFALTRINATLVPLNPEAGLESLRYMLEKSRVSGAFVTAETLPAVSDAVRGLQACPWLVRIDGADDGGAMWQALMSARGNGELPVPRSDATCLIIFTSGTTGFPKGVMHSQRNFLLAGEANVARLWLQPEDRVLTILPLFHTNALFYSLTGALAAGAGVLLQSRFSASRFWDVAAESRATTVNVIESVGRILRARPRHEFRGDHVLESVYGARADVQECFRVEFGISRLVSGFGMTEIPGVCCTPWVGPDKTGSMGLLGEHPDPDVKWATARIVDEQGNDVPDGVPGEFWVKHPAVMQGYFDEPGQTRESFEGEWFKTGDLVKRDIDGYYWFVGRRKDVIRRRGENISGQEIDRVLASHPLVYEAAAIAAPSEWGEDEILVCVAKRQGAEVSAWDVLDWCRERLPAFKVPRYIWMTDELPYTPTHKVAKQKLREDLARIMAAAVDVERDAPASSAPEQTSGAGPVVVVGSGMAGIAAALEARTSGAQVVLFEKFEPAVAGGNTRVCGGAFLAPSGQGADAEKAFVESLAECTHGEGNVQLFEVLARHALPSIRWIQDLGAEFLPAYPCSPPYRCSVHPLAPGQFVGMPALVSRLHAALEAAGVSVRFQTEVLEIIVDDGGAVRGVEIRDAQGKKRREKASAVILAGGGYAGNKAWLKQWVGEGADALMVRGVDTAQGEAIDLAARAGASVARMEGLASLHVAAVCPELPGGGNPSRAIPYAIAVNARGERYVDESKGYVANGKAALRQPQQRVSVIVDSAMLELPGVETALKTYGNMGLPVARADTVDELAVQIGVQPAGLKATIQQFNAAIDGTAAMSAEPPKTAWAWPIAHPPFFAFSPLQPAITLTFGGVEIDVSARVRNRDGSCIQGLYAAGEMAGCLFRHDYLGGASLTNCLVMGRIAGREAASYAARLNSSIGQWARKP
ncbi:precorrin 3B synthase CobZ [Pigmentiphaga kullae]|uniref:Precorrin 3B synthase CobZ n=2 Tax=Pigmentiphaga kullae TaxID=151784 RepID=A0A4Q7NNE4_9BURK|nr:precorrin 3B synthase CobZ [Pigmentiphaga kullae]